MKRLLVAAACAAACALPARADHYADLYVVPVASHVPGVANTNWQSDIAIYNFQSVPLNVEMVLIESGSSTTDNLVPLSSATTIIPPNSSRIMSDVLANQPRPTSSIGAVVVGADRPFAITSRSYSMSPSGDTIGQTVVPSRDFFTETLNDTPSPAVAYIPGLISNGRFRTNIGFAAGAGPAAPLVIDVTIAGADGSEVGTQRFTVPAGSFMHRQLSTTAFGSRQFDAGSAKVTIVSGDGQVVPYASVIDNSTADAVFVSGTFPPNTRITAAASGSAGPFESLLRRFRSR